MTPTYARWLWPHAENEAAPGVSRPSAISDLRPYFMSEEIWSKWDPKKRLSFTIHADTKNIPPTTFDEHVSIGERYFDVLTGTNTPEAVAPDRVILHLSSEQRLSTGFNFYSHWWTEALRADLQKYILGFIKRRCERQSQE
jgi:hypothetical protein